MRNILVTGGLGFIGSHLVETLLSDSSTRVVVVDNLQSNVISVDRMIGEIGADCSDRLEVIIQDVENYEPAVRFAEIFHLASVVGPAGVLGHAGRISEKIVNATSSVVRCAERDGARLVNVSTSEIYGGGDQGLCEEHSPRMICATASARLEYAVAKLASEIALENLCRRGTVDAVTIRPFNVAGVRQSGRGGFVLPRFIGQAIVNSPLTVFGDGTQMRAFTDVRDVVDAMILICRHGEAGTAYNVGNPNNRISIDALADEVLIASHSSSGKLYVDPRDIFGPEYREAADKFPNANRTMSLGWRPRCSLQATIYDVLYWMSHLPPEEIKDVAGLSSLEMANA